MIFRSEEALTPVNTDNCVQKKCNEAFQCVSLLRIRVTSRPGSRSRPRI